MSRPRGFTGGFFQVFKEKWKEDVPTHRLVFINTRTGQTLQNELYTNIPPEHSKMRNSSPNISK